MVKINLLDDEIEEEFDEQSSSETEKPPIEQFEAGSNRDVNVTDNVVISSDSGYTEEVNEDDEEDYDFEYFSGSKKSFLGKPLYITLGVITVVLVFILTMDFWKGKEEEIPQEPIVQQPTEAELAKKRLMEQQAQFLKYQHDIYSRNVNIVSNFIKAIPANTYLSLLQIYDDKLLIELTGSSRDDIARFRINLKQAGLIQYANVISVDEIPSEPGGVLARMSGKLTDPGKPPVSSMDVEKPRNYADANNVLNQIQSLAKSSGLTVKSSLAKGSGKEDVFQMTFTSIRLLGTQDKVVQFVQKLAASNLNIGLSKIAMGREMTGSNIYLTLKLNVYSPAA